MKRIIVVFSLLLYFCHAYSQNEIAKCLADNGFENVAQSCDGNIAYVSLESRDYRNSYMGVAKALKTILDNFGKDEKYNSIELVFAENDLPQLHIGITKELLDGYYSHSLSFSDVVNNAVIDYDIDGVWTKAHKSGAKVLDNSSWKVDFVVYPQLALSNTMTEERWYDYNFCLSPAVEMHLWKGADLTAQVILPLFDNMGGQNKKIRPGIIALTQNLDLGAGFKSKLSVGNFTSNRMGGVIDLLWRSKNGRFMFDVNGGVTVQSIITDDEGWRISDHKRFTGSAAISYYLAALQTMTKLSANHHVYGDNSVRFDVQRHFANYSAGVYAMYIADEFNCGVNVSFPLFSRHYKHNKGFRVRVANSWDLEYSMKSSYKWNELNTEIGRVFYTSTDARSHSNFMQPDYIRYFVAKYGEEVK